MSHTLLLADESAAIQRVVELTFAAEGVRVVTVGDGEQAIARVLSDRPDIVLAGIEMRKASGYDVAAFIKGNQALAHIPVLLLAGAFEAVDLDRMRTTGGDGVLVKPFEPREVIERVRLLLAAAPRSLTAPARTVEPEAAAPGLDDYFDRLDAALTARVKAGPVPPAEPAAVLTVAPDSAPAPDRRRSIAESFSALLAAEQGEAASPPVGVPQSAGGRGIDEALVERAAQRVLERLRSETIRDVVADVVPRLVERLVREELDRIKSI